MSVCCVVHVLATPGEHLWQNTQVRKKWHCTGSSSQTPLSSNFQPHLLPERSLLVAFLRDRLDLVTGGQFVTRLLCGLAKSVGVRSLYKWPCRTMKEMHQTPYPLQRTRQTQQ